ncbi:protein ergS [Aspergillus mulundensis]|uniref:Phosphatidylglycerol lysyltransferase C-terminal domain-containing protein n=1 Tax=Aspergillus mulundensis TaxID=1810919 RepID=A0A3D8T3A4_9EURO|nr:Uncharacterized protein DSM5745_00354 [Aspergillus mulundensis]RDW93032.1 Uncharacterized protein DSM5745_00354 [Aspergillus mulundensis]
MSKHISNATPAITAKPREKVLHADTIGRSLCQRQFRPAQDPPASTAPHPFNLKPTFHTKAPAPQWLAVPGQHLPGSATTSSETLMTESHRTTSFSRRSPPSESEHSSNLSDSALKYPRVVSLGGTATVQDAERLAAEYGLPSQMGLLDPSYTIFVGYEGHGGLCFKVLNKVAVVMGDPMCNAVEIAALMAEFKLYRRRKGWRMSVLGAGANLVEYYMARKRKSTILKFGNNRVLNPLTNEVVHEKSGKRILTQNRQLLNPSKGGLMLDIYTPSLHGTDYKLEWELSSLYHEWCIARNTAATKDNKPQAFITEYDPFLMSSLMTYIYARDEHGGVAGFAALRWVGMKQGYHIDPCIAAPGAKQKGITDLLLFASMAHLRQLNISYLSIGYEPSESLPDISPSAIPVSLAHLADKLYRYTFQRLPLSGKKAYFDKFRPDDAQSEPVYLIFPSRMPRPRDVVAVAHVANIRIRRLLFHGGRGL